MLQSPIVYNKQQQLDNMTLPNNNNTINAQDLQRMAVCANQNQQGDQGTVATEEMTQCGSTHSSDSIMTISLQHEPPTVRFSRVQIREYAVEIGEHSTTQFFPLTLGWGHAQAIDFDIDQYEACRGLAREARHLNVTERMQRIAQVSGIPSSALQVLAEQGVLQRLLEAAEQLEEEEEFDHDEYEQEEEEEDCYLRLVASDSNISCQLAIGD
jgi:hypothetical protein